MSIVCYYIIYYSSVRVLGQANPSLPVRTSVARQCSVTRQSKYQYAPYVIQPMYASSNMRHILTTLSMLKAEFINLTLAGLALHWINNMLTEFRK